MGTSAYFAGDGGRIGFKFEMKFGTSEKESTCVLPFVHPNVRVITCLGSTGM